MSDTQPKLAIRTTSKALTTEYEVMFDAPVEDSHNMAEELYTMRQAKEGDLVKMLVNTDGGRVCTVAAIQGIIDKSEAHFHAILEGDASSAGSMIFLLGDTQEVYPLATMFIHTIQSGIGGHSQEISSYGKHLEKYSERLVRSVYKDFLTEEEIKEVLLGGTFWFDADEINSRLEKRQAIRDAATVQEMKEAYPPDTYAEQAVSDILADCESFGYDIVDLIDRMKEVVADLVQVQRLEELEDGDTPDEDIPTISETDDGIYLDGHFYNIKKCGAGVLRQVALKLGINHAHNIGIEKLRQRILDSLNEED